ncbi:MAG TPA: DUF4148 domain-containing protein [Paraburkholderia sp.]|nr:DUF4148 domain-containing protein [Paraburkholderia sp.]
MNRINRRHAHRALTHAVAAAAFTLAGVHLVQAQDSGSTTTHAAKKAELKKLEQNGYQPSSQDSHYPTDIQNAEKKAAGGAGASGPMPSGAAQ